MAELVHDLPHVPHDCVVCRAKAAAPRRIGQALALFAAGLCVTTGILNLRPHATQHHHVVAARAVTAPAAPAAEVKRGAQARLHFQKAAATEAAREAASAQLERQAAIGVGRGFFNGGVFTTAARVAQWHSLIARSARAAGIDASLLEGIVFVESSGRADVTNGSAVGLTQLHRSVARRLGLRVDARHANRLTHRITHAWNPKTVKQLKHWRARYDERYAPAKAIAATAAYLATARQTLGRDDLAIQAYHTGINALRGTKQSYAAVYFGTGRVDDYALKVVAAERIMKMWRHHRAALAYEAAQQARKNSAEEYLHPLGRTHRFGGPRNILRAEQRHTLRMIPIDVARTHIKIDASFGSQAHKLGRARRLYRALRPQALDVLLYIGARVHALSGARSPLLLTSAVRDNRYQRVLQHVNVNAARSYSLHTTGYAFDIARVYGSDRQARAFQYVLDRLVAANAIAYIREAAAIHVAVASDASRKLKLLQMVG
jgi:hypothetical protein